MLAVLHEVAAGAELEVVADRGGGGGDLAELDALDLDVLSADFRASS